MVRYSSVVAGLWLLHATFAVKVKVMMHSEQEDSKLEDETEGWERKKRTDVTLLPFIKRHTPVEDKTPEYEEEHVTTEKPHAMHPNDMLFPLIYRQSHINSMFKFGVNWYTWSTEKRTDGTKAINYYICYDEPKRCDDVGWERTDAVPKCAFQIDSVLADDRACINAFGVEPHTGVDPHATPLCDGAEQMKVSEIVRSCGPRVRSLWRFVRVGRRPPAVAKPADVNSLVCEDEEECFLTVEYRIHHDRITFSLHEPTRGQTFKSVLKREAVVDEKKTTEHQHQHRERPKEPRDDDRKKFHLRVKNKPAEGKGVVKEKNDSGYASRRILINKVKLREDVSEDISE